MKGIEDLRLLSLEILMWEKRCKNFAKKKNGNFNNVEWNELSHLGKKNHFFLLDTPQFV